MEFKIIIVIIALSILVIIQLIITKRYNSKHKNDPRPPRVPKVKREVFCKDCKHCVVINEYYTWHFCLKYTDFEKVRQHTNPVTGEANGKHYAQCKKINKKGNCKGFEQKEGEVNEAR